MGLTWRETLQGLKAVERECIATRQLAKRQLNLVTGMEEEIEWFEQPDQKIEAGLKHLEAGPHISFPVFC